MKNPEVPKEIEGLCKMARKRGFEPPRYCYRQPLRSGCELYVALDLCMRLWREARQSCEHQPMARVWATSTGANIYTVRPRHAESRRDY